MQTIYHSVAHDNVLEELYSEIQRGNLQHYKFKNYQWISLQKLIGCPFQKCWFQNFPHFLLYNHLKKKEWKRAAYKIDHLRRKRRQIEFYIKLIQQKIQEREEQQKRKVRHIVDFAGGRGDLSFVIAYFFPQIKFTLIDLKKMTINQAKLRKKILKIENINVIEGDIFNFQEEFDFAIGLHACGGLTDIVIQKCLQQKELPSLLICTCCFGKIQSFTDLYSYPQSDSFKANFSEQKFFEICNYAECEVLKKEKFKHEFFTQTEKFQKNDLLKQIDVNSETFSKFKHIRQVLSQNAKYFVNQDRIKFIQEMLAKKQQQQQQIQQSKTGNETNESLNQISQQQKQIPQVQIIELPFEITPKNQILVI